MEWAYLQLASLIGIVAFIVYMAIADSRLKKEEEETHH